MCSPAPSRPISRALLALALHLAAAPAGARAEDVYLTFDQALREVFPEDEAPIIERADLALAPAERERLEKRLGQRIPEATLTVHRGSARDGSVAGYAVVTEEIGKYCPITFIVAVRPDASVKDVAVMVYRESHGSDVRRRRFLAQFEGKDTSDAIRPSRDILNISGATLSVRSVARGVRRVLHVVDEVLIGPNRRSVVAWEPQGFASSAPGKQTSRVEPVRRAQYLMGTVLEATAYGDGAPRALAAAFDEIARLERLMSTFMPESELSRVNRGAAAAPVAVSSETYECVARAVEIARRSDGAFDPTRTGDGWKRVRLDAEARTIGFTEPGIALDLGGIAKGYALDRAAALLRERGVTQAMLNFGGQVLALDAPPGERAWIVAVADPLATPGNDRALGFFEVVNASVSTSSQAERRGHIVDPRTGRPASASLSATIRAASATAADALSTATFVLGPERGRALAATEPGCEVLIVGP